MNGPLILRIIVRIKSNLKLSIGSRTYCSRNDSRVLLSRLYQPIQQKGKEGDLCKSYKLLIQHGFVRQCGPGLYHILPFGQRVIEKLSKLIDECMTEIDAQKMCMASLCPSSLWKQSGRLEKITPEILQLTDKQRHTYLLSPTHEEQITSVVGSSRLSYKQLPQRLYQIGWKWRDEMRPRAGMLRAREFLMKDLYSFDVGVDEAMESYNMVSTAYQRLFERLKLKHVKASASSGNIGGEVSHEYQLLSDVGEDRLRVCESCGHAANVEVQFSCDCDNPKVVEKNGIEVGHTFLLGTRYSKPLDAFYTDSERKCQPLVMGCYGLGVTRLMAAAVEVLSTETQIRWPEAIAPYSICIISPKRGSKEDVDPSVGWSLYDSLSEIRDVVYDDRTSMTIGRRLMEAECVGYPYVIVIGKSMPLYEVRHITTGQQYQMTHNQIMELFKHKAL